MRPKANLKAYFLSQNERQKISEHTLKCLLKAIEIMGKPSTETDEDPADQMGTNKRKRTALAANVAENTPALKLPRVHMPPYRHAILGGLTSKTMSRQRGLTATEELGQTQLHYCEPIIMKDSRHVGRPMTTPIFAQLSPVYVCLLYTSPSPRDRTRSRMPSSA